MSPVFTGASCQEMQTTLPMSLDLRGDWGDRVTVRHSRISTEYQSQGSLLMGLMYYDTSDMYHKQSLDSVDARKVRKGTLFRPKSFSRAFVAVDKWSQP